MTFHRCVLPVSVHLAERFQRRRLKCEKLTDDGRQVMAKAHFAFGIYTQSINHTNALLIFKKTTTIKSIGLSVYFLKFSYIFANYLNLLHTTYFCDKIKPLQIFPILQNANDHKILFLGYKNCVSKALFYQTRNSDIHYGQLLLSCFILILTFGNFQSIILTLKLNKKIYTHCSRN
jgi:hypothetical protein